MVGDSDTERRFYLQVWRGSDLATLHQDRFVSTASIELPFIPYQLVHFGKGKLWLAGSDCKVHQFDIHVGPDLCVTESAEHPLSSFTFTSPVIKMGTGNCLDTKWVAVGCEDGHLAVYQLVEAKAKQVLTHNFEGLSDVNFAVVDGQQVNLVVVASMGVSKMFLDLSADNYQPNLVSLDKSNDYDVALTTCNCLHGDENQTVTLLGTYGQEILIYDTVSGNLLGQHSVNHPILCMLPADNKSSVAVMTNKSVEILEIK